MSDREVARYRYIHFIDIVCLAKPKTRTYRMYNNSGKYHMADISWYPAWRQYVWEPMSGMVYNSQCLIDINDFLIKANQAHKEGRSL